MHINNKFKIKLVTAAILGLGAMGIANAACNPTAANRPVCPAGAAPENATFIDPTASISSTSAANTTIGKHTYIAPFAGLSASSTQKISIGEKTNLQDSVIVTSGSSGNGVKLGDEVILAHGAQVRGPSKIGRTAVEGQHNAAFVGFNSRIVGGNVEYDAMVLHMARVGPGVTIKHGKVVLSGKNVTTQAQADTLTGSNPKVVVITTALRDFMDGVLHVNETFAREYTRMFQEGGINTVRGINYDPGYSDFNPNRDLPTLAGVATQSPQHRNRIIGDIVMGNDLDELNGGDFGSMISLRTDEGEPFHLGKVDKMADRTTFHALEHSGLDLHNDIEFGFRSIVHGGASAATVGNPHSNTVVGDNVKIGDYAVVFRSVLAQGVEVGCGSLVDSMTLADGTVVPSRQVWSPSGVTAVEWNPGC